MANPEIVWAFLPNGIKDGRLRFSAAVSIRLPEEAGPRPNLGLFPEVLNWAETVGGLTFDVQFEKAAPVEATRTSPDPDPELWQAIFQPDSPVVPYQFADLTKNAVLSFPVKHVQSFLAQQYLNVAAESPEEPPPIEKIFRNEALAQVRMKPVTNVRFAGAVQPRTTADLQARTLRTTLDRQKVKAVPVQEKPQPPQDFYMLRLYHQPRNKAVVDPKTKVATVQRVAIAPPELDFHQAVSHISNYPALTRLLGLAFDFEVPVPPAFPGSGLVKIVPRGRTGDKTPWTKCVFNAGKGVFEAASRSSKPDVVDGFLDLSDEETYDLIQVDVDGAALKTAELADKAEDATTGDLPALRSNGFSVVRTGNAVRLAEAFRAAVDLNQTFVRSRELTFYSEDLVQGYRVDVWDEGKKAWHSLCKRIGTYSFLRNGREVVLEDEGFTSESVTQAADDSSDDLYTHESIFGWNGWSLVAPRPGKTIDEEDKVADVQSRAATAFRLETKFKPAPGSLPKLRFGGKYRLRARAVDLAGNSLGLESDDAAKAIPAPPKPAVSYDRFDPVPPPVVVLREEPGSGETVDEVVIRSYNDGIEKDTVPTGETAERHVAAPKTSQLGAETHGVLDAEGGGPRKDLYGLIAEKDPGELREIEEGEEIELPYFPDPWAKGVVVRGLPGVPADKPMRITFAGEWPDARGFRIRVVEGKKAAEWNEPSRVLTVYLEKSDVATLRLSCWFPEPMLPNLGLYKWLEKPEIVIPKKILEAPQATGSLLVVPAGIKTREEVKAEERAAMRAKVQAKTVQRAGAQTVRAKPVPAQAQAVQAAPTVRAQAQEVRPVFQLPRINIARIRTLAVAGSHWMMTPFRTVVLSHAVQQPIGKPGAKKFMMARGLGETYALFDAELDVHGSSSQKFDMSAVWQEPVDNLAEKTWKMLDGSAEVLEQTLERGKKTFVMNEETDHRHEFGDTKYRRVTYTLTETTRFREQMPEAIAKNVELLIRKSDPITVDVPNAAPPAIPKVVYVVPTFGWERKRELGRFTSLRKGGGLRVYLERPWFSSGEGELLGVVLGTVPGVQAERAAAGTTAGGRDLTARIEKEGIMAVEPKLRAQAKVAARSVRPVVPSVPESVRPYVTLWGLDPLWRAGGMGTPEYPLPGDFGKAEEVLGGLVIPELPDTRVFTAVGHKVEYDEERGLWYCDVEIDPHDAYFPFVRLALARFQPISVRGAHLSKVVTADFIQLAPDRTVSLAFNRSNLREMNVTVSGASYVQAAAGSGPGEVEVALETRNIALPEEIGWTEVPKTGVTLRAQRVPRAEPGNFIWAGKLSIPRGIELKAYRVAIREYETFLSDDLDRAAARPATRAAAPALKKVRRLVFAETFPLLDL